MKKLNKQLFKLLRLHSPSGSEANVRRYLLPILQSTMDNVFIDSYGNLYAEKKYGNSDYTVLFSSHMDTVAHIQPIPQWRKNKTEIFTSSGSALGGDDKCGIASFLAVIREMNRTTQFTGTLKVIFSRQEEIGCVGASQAVSLTPEWFKDVKACVVVDRRDDDNIVTGTCGENFCSDEYANFWVAMAKKAGFKAVPQEGSISDTMIFSEIGINGVNLSAGYYNAHTKDEYIKIAELKRTTQWVYTAMNHIQEQTFPSFTYFDESYKTTSYWKGGNKYYTSSYSPKVWDRWVVCDVCRFEWEKDEMLIDKDGLHICPDCADHLYPSQQEDTFECEMCMQEFDCGLHIDYRGHSLCPGCCLALDVSLKEGV